MIREALIKRMNLEDILLLNLKTLRRANEPLPQLAIFNRTAVKVPIN